MKEHPILFSSPMVRAIIEGRKTQTRRVIRALGNIPHIDRLLGEWSLSEEPVLWTEEYRQWQATRKPKLGDWVWRLQTEVDDSTDFMFRCPYGSPGDVLWVRETAIISPPNWCDKSSSTHPNAPGGPRCIQHLATYPCRESADEYGLKATPSIHMPRWACRLTLTVVDIRVERVQEISEEDAQAEGCALAGGWNANDTEYGINYRGPFSHLWDELNAARGYSWESNPWVWVVTFAKREGTE